MKKIVLGALAVTLCVTLTACGTSANNATLTNLGNQLDETANTISNIQTVNPTDLNLTKNTLEQVATKETTIYNNAVQTQQSLLTEEYYKTDILNRTAKIKNNLSKDIKLTKAQTSALKDLTNNLTKYTNSVSYSQGEMNSSIKFIVSMKKNVDKNMEKINAKLNRLACNSNARSSYYENILNTLDQIDSCVSSNYSNIETEPKQTEPTKTTEEQNKNEDSTKKTGLQKNIDSYTTYPERRIMPYNPKEPIYRNCDENSNCINKNLPYENSYNNENVATNESLNRYNRFNMTRNTDTYGPTMRNIDTYGGFGNGYGYGYGMNNGMYGYGGNYGYGVNGGMGRMNNGIYNSNNINRMTTPVPVLEQNIALANTEIPEKRLEDFEKINEDNTVEKIENIDNEIVKNKTENVVVIKDKSECVDENCENKTTSINVEKKSDSSVENDAEKIGNLKDEKQNEENKVESKTENNQIKTFKSPKIRIVDMRKVDSTETDEMNQVVVAHEVENETTKINVK